MSCKETDCVNEKVGSKYCEIHKIKCRHQRQRARCKDCLGYSSNKGRCSRCRKPYIPCDDGGLQTCEECRYYSNCPHGVRIKGQCKECQRISTKKHRNICEHGKRKDTCSKCSACEHGKHKDRCIKCCACKHGKFEYRCKECNPIGYLTHTVSNSVRRALKSDKSQRSIEYLGCDIETYKKYIEEQFEEGMSWENHGEWHIDHIEPIKYKV